MALDITYPKPLARTDKLEKLTYDRSRYLSLFPKLMMGEGEAGVCLLFLLAIPL